MIIGITGGYGSGKSSVAGEFARLGAKVIDADRIVHGLIDAPTRRDLAKVVFKRKRYLELLCRIIHPLVIKEIKKQLKRDAHKKMIIVIDAPLLIESGLSSIVDKLIVVKTKKETQIKRAIKSSGLKRKEVLRRIGFQLPLSKKIKLADFVIDNEATFKETRKQVKDIWERL